MGCRALALPLALLSAVQWAAATWRAEFDVVVYGATSAGVMTAIGAANASAARVTVALVVVGDTPIGGMTSGGLSDVDAGDRSICGGFARDFFFRAGQRYTGRRQFLPKAQECKVSLQLFEQMLAEVAGAVTVFRRVSPELRVDLSADGRRVVSIATEDGSGNGLVLEGKVFVDASYEGDLLRLSGASYALGREAKSTYNEPHAGVQPWPFAGSDPGQLFPPWQNYSVDPFDQAGRPLPMVGQVGLGRPGSADRKIMAYNFRVCLTNNQSNMAPLPRPPGYSEAQYELLRRYLAIEPELHALYIEKCPGGHRQPGCGMFIWGKLKLPGADPAKLDLNTLGPISTNMVGGSWEWPLANASRRAQIFRAHKFYQQGLLYFLATSKAVPVGMRTEMASYGLCMDEFEDSDNWPTQLYVRESIRLVNEFVLREGPPGGVLSVVQGVAPDNSSIGIGNWGIDVHQVQRVALSRGGVWRAVDEGDLEVPAGSFEIPYGSIVPRKAEVQNLLIPTCIAASHLGYGAYRLESPYMVVGHSAGVAAAMAVADGVAVQDVDLRKLQATLRSQGQILTLAERRPGDYDPARADSIPQSTATHGGYVPQPAIHYTPPPWLGQMTGGDIAGALLHPVTKVWHVMPLSHVGWAHISTADLVSWQYHGNSTSGGGPRFESGGLIYDHQRNVTVAFANSPTDASISRSADLALGSFEPPTVLYATTDPLNAGTNKTVAMGCWDPVMWWDERVSLFYAANACGHCDPGDTPPEHDKGIHCTGGEGLELYWSAPGITGPWTELDEPFLVEKTAFVPRVGSWPRPHEFVTPDFFPLPAAEPESSAFRSMYGFLTTSYGDMRWTGLPGSNSTNSSGLCYDYANYYIGPRPIAGGSFMPALESSAPFDWSPFTPADNTSTGLTFAVSTNMEQFGCCPKTAGDSSRRVLFGWINNGWNQGGGRVPNMQAPNNTLSLPRDLTVTRQGRMRQRFVPELANLRRGLTHMPATTLPTGGVAGASFVAGASGLQLEVVAKFRVPDQAAAGKFGLLVLASDDKQEYTAIGLDQARRHILLDRTRSGVGLDADLRAGPWPAGESGADANEVTVHAYVDHAVVELIAHGTASGAELAAIGDGSGIESTAIAAWVQPTSASSNRIALFSERPGVALVSLHIWQLATPNHGV